MPIIQAIFENGVFRPVQPVEAQGDEDGKVYWLVAPEDVPKLWADHVAAEVDRGLDAIDRGDVVEWDGARDAAARPRSRRKTCR